MPARRCILSLVVLADTKHPIRFAAELGEVERLEFEHKWATSHLYKSGWATSTSHRTTLDCWSWEWQLQTIVLGRTFAASLVSGDANHLAACGELLTVLQKVHGSGTRADTSDAHGQTDSG